MNLIGISGTNGSGKDTLGKMLAERHGWLFVSITDILRDELKKRGLPIERDNLRNLSAEWRRQSGLGVLIDKANELLESRNGKYKGLAIASLRNPGEADRVRQLGGKVVWLDADPKMRYQRNMARHRSAEDKKTFAEFLTEEQAEMKHSGDDATLSMSGVKAKADIFLKNNSNDIETFKDQAEKALGL
jgi:dephospho-CoA kinase